MLLLSQGWVWIIGVAIGYLQVDVVHIAKQE